MNFFTRLKTKCFRPVKKTILSWIERDYYSAYFHYPFGNKCGISPEEYYSIWRQEKESRYPVVDEYERGAGYAIEGEWFHSLALLTQVIKKKSSICYQHGRLLYTVLRNYLHNNQPASVNIIETGTARGFSSLCMAKALQDANAFGTIFTFDIIPHTCAMYWNCVKDCEGPRTRAELLQDYEKILNRYLVFIQGDTDLMLKKIYLPRVHFAFLDGCHTYDAVRLEFEYIREKQVSGDIVFFDDYTPDQFPGVVKAVDEICVDYHYKKEVIAVNRHRGYVISRKQ